MAKKNIENKNGVKTRLVLSLGCIFAFTLLLATQNIAGLWLAAFSLMAVFCYFSRSRLLAGVISVLVLLVSIFQIWNSDVYKVEYIERGCLDICIGQDLMIWTIKFFSLVLIPLTLYLAASIIKEWNNS